MLLAHGLNLNGEDQPFHPCAIIKFTQKNLKRVVTYTHELPMGHGSQNWFWSFHIGPSGENSDPQFLGHKIKIDPILLILVPNDTHRVPSMPTKFYLTESSQL